MIGWQFIDQLIELTRPEELGNNKVLMGLELMQYNKCILSYLSFFQFNYTHNISTLVLLPRLKFNQDTNLFKRTDQITIVHMYIQMTLMLVYLLRSSILSTTNQMCAPRHSMTPSKPSMAIVPHAPPQFNQVLPCPTQTKPTRDLQQHPKARHDDHTSPWPATTPRGTLHFLSIFH